MDGFKRPVPRVNEKEPELPRVQPPQNQYQQQSQPVAEPKTQQPSIPSKPMEKPLAIRSHKRWWLWPLGIVVVIILLVAACFAWYRYSLTPVNTKNPTVQQVQIGENASFSFISGRLEERGLIRSALALRIYATLHHEAGGLKQGACNLLPNEPAVEILHKLNNGCNDFKVVTFYPGATIERPQPVNPAKPDFSIRGSLEKAGFSDKDITVALAQTYTGPLFQGKPAGASLEGYVYGDTYFVNIDAGPQQALKDAFAEMEKVVEANDLVAKYKAHGLTLYQGITLASIVQRELSCDNLKAPAQTTCYTNQQEAAQVFYSRLQQSMTLGSDVTFIYAAGLTGEAASPLIDSPYNTRIQVGLPPGPIAVPSEFALKAVANPAPTDYLYFIAGDEGGGAMYFAKTQAEHEKNIQAHCQVQCK